MTEETIIEPPDVPIEQSFKDITACVKKAPEWVINDLIPVGITFLAGPPKKAYKSTMTVIMACLCAQWGTSAFAPWMYATMFGPSLLFSYEADGGEILWVIEEGLQTKPKDGYIYVTIDPWEFQLDVPKVIDKILAYLNARKPRLIIMDPFRNMWSGDENDSGQVIACLGPLRKWAKDNQAAIIVVHHINKPSEQVAAGSMYSMRGSSAIPGLADGIVVVEATKHEGQIRLHTTFKRGTSYNRLIQLGVPGFGWPAEGYEMLPELAHSVKHVWKQAPRHDVNWLDHVVREHDNKVSVAAVKEALAMLVRNEHIEMDALETKLFLGGTR